VGAKLLNYVDYPTSEVLGPEATGEQIKDLNVFHDFYHELVQAWPAMV
jgi:hypothetical protein